MLSHVYQIGEKKATYHVQGQPVHSNGMRDVFDQVINDSLRTETGRVTIVNVSVRLIPYLIRFF